MVFGKTIKIFLIDGDPNGRMSCELSNYFNMSITSIKYRIEDLKLIIKANGEGPISNVFK